MSGIRRVAVVAIFAALSVQAGFSHSRNTADITPSTIGGARGGNSVNTSATIGGARGGNAVIRMVATIGGARGGNDVILSSNQG